MESRTIVTSLAGICILLLIMPAVSAAVVVFAFPVPLIGANIPNFFEEKSKTLYTYKDFENDARTASDAGNFEEAIKNLNMAEAKVKASPEMTSGTFNEKYGDLQSLDRIYENKAKVYAAWPGHTAEAAQASQTAASYAEEAHKSKMENERQGGLSLPVWVPVFALLAAVFLVQRCKRL
jgi:hypothetical protein